MFDISAAPTTYAMSYRPYEVEDQDNLQRGHIAEYLLAAQDALRDRLKDQAAAGRPRLRRRGIATTRNEDVARAGVEPVQRR